MARVSLSHSDNEEQCAWKTYDCIKLRLAATLADSECVTVSCSGSDFGLYRRYIPLAELETDPCTFSTLFQPISTPFQSFRD